MLKSSDNPEELQAVKEMVDIDIARQRSRDTGGDDGRSCGLDPSGKWKHVLILPCGKALLKKDFYPPPPGKKMLEIG